MKRRLFWLVTLGLALLIAAGLCEGVLRVMHVHLEGSTYTLDRELGWGLRAGATAWHTGEGEAWTRINSFGYRDRERTLEKPAGVFRIAVLGDSYTEARGVDMSKTFTALSEGYLRACPGFGSGVEVLNFGVSGYGTGQELLTLEKRVWQFDPDLILLQFFAGNDLFNNYRKLNVSDADITPYFVLDGDGLRLDDSFAQLPQYQPLRFHMKRALATVLNSSRFLLLLYQVRLRLAERSQIAQLASRAAASGGPPPHYQSFWFYEPPQHPWMKAAWEVTERLLVRMHRETAEKNRALWVMLTPTPEQILPSESERRAFAERYHVEDLDYADKRVLALAEREGFHCVNTTAELRSLSETRQQYLTGFANTKLGTGHFNEVGHEVLARLLSREICGWRTAAAAPAAAGEASR
jgi:GDSL-like Lipase/Acylhydrolase